MKIFDKYNLKSHNTFNIDVTAKGFISIETKEDFIEVNNIIDFENDKYFILGAGSNLLFTNNFNGTIISIENSGYEIIEDNTEYTLISFAAGNNWHNTVKFCVENSFFGLENLALIPGKIGAAPVQNIGAYGIEQCDLIHSVKAFKNANEYEFSKDELNFSYRYSIFKEEEFKNYIISEVTYKLHKDRTKINCKYKDVNEYFLKNKIENPTPLDVFNAVVEIRNMKLPDPLKIGNAGSFFKNPIIKTSQLNELLENYPNLVHFNYSDTETKVSAANLIDLSGLKGYRTGDAGIYDKHALILCNYGNSSGKELYDLSEYIIRKVYEKFSIQLEREVIVIT